MIWGLGCEQAGADNAAAAVRVSCNPFGRICPLTDRHRPVPVPDPQAGADNAAAAVWVSCDPSGRMYPLTDCHRPVPVPDPQAGAVNAAAVWALCDPSGRMYPLTDCHRPVPVPDPQASAVDAAEEAVHVHASHDPALADRHLVPSGAGDLAELHPAMAVHRLQQQKQVRTDNTNVNNRNGQIIPTSTTGTGETDFNNRNR